VEQSRAGELIQGIKEPRFGTLTLSVLVVLTMIIAVPIGLFYALVNAPAQTIIHERAPAEMRGRYFGTQLMLANLSSLVLLLVVGVLIDLTSVIVVVFMYAPVVLAVALYGLYITRRYESSEPVKDEPGPPAGLH